MAHTPPNAKYVGTEGECDGEFLWAGRGAGGSRNILDIY